MEIFLRIEKISAKNKFKNFILISNCLIESVFDIKNAFLMISKLENIPYIKLNIFKFADPFRTYA
jgi:hypothetical protein